MSSSTMAHDHLSTLTPAQRATFEKFAHDPSTVVDEEVPPPVLRALEERYRPTRMAILDDVRLFQKSAPVSGELLTAADAARLLNVSLISFARSVERSVSCALVGGRVMYLREELMDWDARRVANRKPPKKRKKR